MRWLFAITCEKEEPIWTSPQDRRTHGASIAEDGPARTPSGLDGYREMSGATNEVGAPETGLWFSEPVPTPQADDLHPVLGPVVTAQRYPITSCSKVTDRRSYLLLAYKNGSLTLRMSRAPSRLGGVGSIRVKAAHR